MPDIPSKEAKTPLLVLLSTAVSEMTSKFKFVVGEAVKDVANRKPGKLVVAEEAVAREERTAVSTKS